MTVGFTPKITPAKKVAALSIDFVIVGGGLSGLACAIALRRVGHRVTVLERHPDVAQSAGGCRLAPNVSKILFHWGLEQEIKNIGSLSKGINFHIMESGEYIGSHTWDEEVIRETRGEFLFTHHADLRKVLYDAAVQCGAQIRLGVTVTSVDPDNQRVQLSSGEIVRGDVIIGADGVNGVTRKLLVDEDSVPEHRNNFYSTVVSTKSLLRDPELEGLIGPKRKGMFGWFGNGRSALLFPVGGEEEYALMVYSPVDGHQGTWDKRAPLEGMQQVLANAESRVRKLAKLSMVPPSCVPVKHYPEPEDWAHESGRLLLIGEAVHPLPPGCIQEAAMAVEDGAVLAKLFSHLRTHDQIPTFLSAFQDLRTPRCQFVLKKELDDVKFMTMPPCETQQMRDNMMRMKRDAGIGALDSLDDSEEELPQWVEIKELFGYDAEDDADNWWMEWGLLRERAKGTDVTYGFVQPAEVAVQTGVRLSDITISA